MNNLNTRIILINQYFRLFFKCYTPPISNLYIHQFSRQYKYMFYLKYIYYFATHSRSVIEKGFGDSLLLPDSDKFDCGMCVHALDVDFDGENELLLGTYGQVRALVLSCSLYFVFGSLLPRILHPGSG